MAVRSGWSNRNARASSAEGSGLSVEAESAADTLMRGEGWGVWGGEGEGCWRGEEGEGFSRRGEGGDGGEEMLEGGGGWGFGRGEVVGGVGAGARSVRGGVTMMERNGWMLRLCCRYT